MNEQDSESLDSLRESSALEFAIKMAENKGEVRRIIHGYDLSEDDFTNRFPALAKVAQGLPDGPDAPDEAAPPV